MASKKEITAKSSKKKTQKNNNKKIVEKKKNKRIILYICGVISLLLFIGVSLYYYVDHKDNLVIKLDDISFNESDFNMYAYLVKKDYYGESKINLTKEELNTIVTGTDDMKVSEYLKEKTITKMKISASIIKVANENNITLDEDDYKTINDKKEEFIESLGDNKDYRKFLKNNRTTDDAYNKIAIIERYYEKIFDKLYSNGGRNDLTSEEKEKYTLEYQNSYVKIKQIILLKKDLNSNTYLDDTTLNQKEALINNLLVRCKAGEDFNELMRLYSEAYNENATSEYYELDSLLSEIREEVDKLSVGDISNIISSENAYHIILKEELDDYKLEDFFDKKREENLVSNISSNMEKIVTVKGDYYEKMAIK